MKLKKTISGTKIGIAFEEKKKGFLQKEKILYGSIPL